MQRHFSNRGEAHAERVAAQMNAGRHRQDGAVGLFPQVGRKAPVIWRDRESAVAQVQTSGKNPEEEQNK